MHPAPARRLAVATYALSPGINNDDKLLIECLQARGIASTPVVWNDPAADWSGFDAILIRSIWDYYEFYPAFLEWLTRLDQLGVPTINSTSLLRWNSDKRYLLQLPALGVAIIPTQVATANELPNVLASVQGMQVVLKPTVSGSAWHTVRGVVGSAHFNAAVTALPASFDYLVQPFIPEIESDGEWSMLFFDNVYSHAVRKWPAPNDYRVQSEFGGSVERVTPDNSMLVCAQKALAAVQTLGYRDGCYARIDGVRSGSQFLIMEIEMIEPFLFLTGADGSSERFAEVIARRLAVSS